MVLVSVNTPDDMSYIRKLAIPSFEDGVAPAVVPQVWKAIHKRSRGICGINRNQKVNGKGF
jgi:hypothetical protein